MSTQSTVKGPKSSQSRVVMFVLNAFRHDTRVEKQARMLVDAGCDVVVIALRIKDVPRREWRDGYRILRIDPAGSWFLGLVLFRFLRCYRFSPSLVARLFGVRLVEPSDEAVRGGRRRRSVVRRGRDSKPAKATENAGGSLLRVLQVSVAVVLVFPVRALIGGFRWVRRRSAVVARNARARLRNSEIRLPGLLASFIVRAYRVCRRTFRRLGRGWSRFTRRVMKPIVRRLPSGVRSLGNDLHVARLGMALSPDLIVAHDTNTLPAALVVSRVTGTPFVFDSHELFLERNLPSHLQASERWLWSLPERDGVHAASARFSVSNLVCDSLRDRYGVDFEELPNAQEFEEGLEADGRLQTAIGVASTTPVAIYVGRVTRGRGLELLPEAATLRQDVHWVVMGPGSEGGYATSLAEDLQELEIENVHILPPVPSSEVGYWLLDATVAIVPTNSGMASYQLGLGNKSFHALAAGLPQVLSDQPGKRRFAEETGAAVVFDLDDSDSLASQVGRVVDDPVLRERLRISALQAGRRFDWRIVGERYRERCLEVMETAS